MRKDRTHEMELCAGQIIGEIKYEAKALHIPDKTADFIAERVSEAVMRWVEKRISVTKDDLDRKVTKVLEKYDRDLAYVYQNRGKII